MTGLLDSQSIHLHADGAFAQALAGRFEALGAAVTRSPATPAPGTRAVIIAVQDVGGLAPMPFADLSEDEWVRRCEAPLDTVRHALLQALTVLGKGGDLLFLIPSLALSGAADFAPYSALGEGVRLLAKALARSEGERGITVNCLALDAALLNPGATAPALGRVPPALPPPSAADIADHIANLLNGPRLVTGSTVVLDGGDYMWV